MCWLTLLSIAGHPACLGQTRIKFLSHWLQTTWPRREGQVDDATRNAFKAQNITWWVEELSLKKKKIKKITSKLADSEIFSVPITGQIYLKDLKVMLVLTT